MLTPDLSPHVQLAVLLLGTLLIFVSVFLAFKIRGLYSELWSRRYFEKISPVGLALLDPDTGALVQANPRILAILEITGAPSEADIFAYFTPEDGERFRGELTARNAVEPAPFKLRFSEKRNKWVLSAANLATIKGKRVLALLMHEVTEVMELRLELEKTKHRMTELIRSLPDGLVVATSEGRVLYVSDAVTHLHGPDQKPLKVGDLLTDRIEPEMKEYAAQFIKKIQGPSNDEVAIFKHQLPDGSVAWNETHGTLINDPITGSDAIMLSIRDITKRMQAEEKVRQQATTLQETLAKLAKLQDDMLSICAWTKKVHVDGKWVPVDAYLSEHLGLTLTHSISEEAIAQLEKESGMNLKEENP